MKKDIVGRIIGHRGQGVPSVQFDTYSEAFGDCPHCGSTNEFAHTKAGMLSGSVFECDSCGKRFKVKGR